MQYYRNLPLINFITAFQNRFLSFTIPVSVNINWQHTVLKLGSEVNTVVNLNVQLQSIR